MKAHQNIILDGIDVGDRSVRKNSNFCNEGKWNNFVKPLLPSDPTDLTFFEYGSNAGLFLRMATEYRFRKVYGLEGDTNVCKIAEQYRDSFKLKYKILNQNIDEDFDYKKLPLSDISLIANFHYHLQIPVLRHFINALEIKACYALVVSVNPTDPNRKTIPWMASAEDSDVLSYFRHWKKVGQVNELSTENDPHPRRMFSYLFKSPKISRIPIHKIIIRNRHHERRNVLVNDFICRILTERKLDIRNTSLYRLELRNRKRKYPEDEIYRAVLQRANNIRDFAKNGMRDPIIIDRYYNILDGHFRYHLLKILGYQSAIVRTI